jgi:hypothetical protein
LEPGKAVTKALELAGRAISNNTPIVAGVPRSSFYTDPARGRHTIRFAFPKRLETLEAAAGRLAALG